MGKLEDLFLKTWGTSDDFVRKSIETAAAIFGKLAKTFEEFSENVDAAATFMWDCQEAAEEILEKNYEPQ